ncbi:MAG: NAD(P)-dependent oxidoreductase [Lachnospiraceae bacterium]|jgi:GDP-L-fucose synthase|nr:NAD(P)-dependent oxidoreductase [Lachnospiraceae bacterium]
MEMKKVLLTGGSGFIGRNIKEYLSGVCKLYAPTRKELNLLDEGEVRTYIKENKIDIVIHSANPNPVKNELDKPQTMFEDSIRVFMNLYNAQDYYERMYTLGSGAEYDKSKDIVLIKEDEEGRSVPYDSYGLAKFAINRIIEGSSKQCNLRIFACYGPTDHESKFITHVIHCCMKNEDITIRQNCYFDYMHVSDLGKILEYFIYNTPKHQAYNVCTGTRKTLEEIAGIVKEQMKSESNIVILNSGWNKEYTGSNERLLDEIGKYQFMSLEDGIKIQIESETK